MSEVEANRGRLFVVGTPIGNLEDITLRALRILGEVELILAEDTRHSGHLTRHHGIATPLRALHAHTSDESVERVLDELEQGHRYALVSDAGTPVVSDPGARLVAGARARGIDVESVPGPSAVATAVSVCGLRADRFRFVGFVPRSGGARTDLLRSIAASDDAQVLFESPRRLPALLGELEPLLRDRKIAVCRELTKLHEEVALGTAAELAARFETVRGEVTLVVEGRGTTAPDFDVDTFIRERLASGEKVGSIAKAVAALSTLSRSEAYDRVHTIRQAADTP